MLLLGVANTSHAQCVTFPASEPCFTLESSAAVNTAEGTVTLSLSIHRTGTLSDLRLGSSDVFLSFDDTKLTFPSNPVKNTDYTFSGYDGVIPIDPGDPSGQMVEYDGSDVVSLGNSILVSIILKNPLGEGAIVTNNPANGNFIDILFSINEGQTIDEPDKLVKIDVTSSTIQEQVPCENTDLCNNTNINYEPQLITNRGLYNPPTDDSVLVIDDIIENTTWTAENTYLLDGLIFVHAGVTLNIEPGTVIKARECPTFDPSSALIIRRDAAIEAEGTENAPIIFTSEHDDVNDSKDLSQRDRGLWGGLIILGNATTNHPSTNNQFRGIPEEEDALYGGDDDDDNSGTFKYVSIRHSGHSISNDEAEEVGGLTLGAVGRNTTIEYVEVFASLADCIAWFGGTVNTQYLVGAFCGDDSFDSDVGFRGRGQFWFSIHDDDIAGRGGEHDGGPNESDDLMPFSTPIISNVTYIGSGANANVLGGDTNDLSVIIRDNADGQYLNSIFTDYPGEALTIEDLADDAVEDSRNRFEANDLAFSGNLWWNFGRGSTLADIVAGDFAESTLEANNNEVIDPDLASIGRTADSRLDPRPNAGSPALVSSPLQVTDPDEHFSFEQTSYQGAFSNTNNWLENWTALSNNSFLGDHVVAVSAEDPEEIPQKFALSQNYPNPFYGETTIAYMIDKPQEISLIVFDLLGREVAVIEQGFKKTGYYAVQFNAVNLASGNYFYHLSGVSQKITKSFYLMK